MKRPKKKYNLRTEIRSAIRKLWMWSPMRREALARARIGRGIYKCLECGGLFGPKQMDVDHKIKVTPLDFDPNIDPTQWGIVIKNMLYIDPIKDIVAMCKPCHKTKTKDEKSVGKAKTKTKKAKAEPAAGTK